MSNQPKNALTGFLKKLVGAATEPRDGPPDQRPSLKSWKDVLKIIIFVTTWYLTYELSVALHDVADYKVLGKTISVFHQPVESIQNVLLWGLVLGLAHGAIMVPRVLVFIWVGPTFFESLYPVLVAAARFSTPIIAALRRGWVTVSPVPANPVVDPPSEDGNNDKDGKDGKTGDKGGDKPPKA
jgi:hypothetical protein